MLCMPAMPLSASLISFDVRQNTTQNTTYTILGYSSGFPATFPRLFMQWQEDNDRAVPGSLSNIKRACCARATSVQQLIAKWHPRGSVDLTFVRRING